MNICYVIGAGELPLVYISNRNESLIIAADGGFKHLGEIKPDIVVGDFDSLGFVPDCPNTVVLPVEKDVTDMCCAANIGLEKGCKTFVIYGGTGGRPDHTFANYALMSALCKKGAEAYLIGNGFVATVIKDGEFTLPLKENGTVSVFALENEAEGVTIDGLKYCLSKAHLSFSKPLGVSNSFIGKRATVSVQKGELLVIWEENNIKEFIDKLYL